MKIKRIFECKNGHRYESKEPVQSSIQQGMRYAISGNKNIKCNSFCKICDSPIIKEEDYVNGKEVMGAVRI